MRVIGLTVLVGFSIVACSDTPDAASVATAESTVAAAEALGPIAVEAVEVKWDRLIDDIVASGLIRGAHEVTVVSETQGVIEAVGIDLGARVEAGDLLVTFDDSIETLALDEANASVSAAELDLQAAERLVSSGNAPQIQLARARTALAGARARLARAEKALADRTIEAPIGGLIASKDRSVQTGNAIGAGATVARIVDTSAMEVVLAVGEREIRYLEDGIPAFVTIPSVGNREIAAAITAIAAASDPGTGSFPVVVRWENSLGERVRAGLSATVRIPPSGAPWAITVPVNAIVTTGDERSIFVVSDDGFARRRAIERGSRAGDRVVIPSGLAAGERVIVSGLGEISDGTRVEATVRLSSREATR